ncbi:alpha-2-macroglobulin-P-like [Gouania willdenowi]|uniref:alpha-2-macroglobulin-P-like n=1 Tax=Gouania willdenowi TaxID=441366 RepID=UPI0010544801|nr:alpha-2-macroglobulin-P-like [Gouania willdenowi]
MAVALLLLCVLVSSSLPSSSSSSASLNDTMFAVAVSSFLTAGHQESVCAHVQDPTQPVTLTVVLDMKTEKTLVLEESVTHNFYRCLSFQVPTVLRETLAFLEVTLRGQNSSLIKKTKVVIHPPSFIHVVQTDKPIYKPGQTVKFRIVSMDSSFVPVGRVYKVVALQDPNSNRIAQWLNQTMDQGIIDLSHPIITEAEQGSYTITAETHHGEHISHSFDIKQYVLPKYEVKVHLPTVISILDQEVTFRVCGKYTYGKPVIGSVKAEFCRERSTMFWLPKPFEDICRKFELTTDQSGCVAQTVDLGPFGLDQDMYADRFRVSAEMEEFGTGVVLKGVGLSSFSSDIRTVTFEDVPEAYKPGIPFEGKVKVVGPDNKAVPNENVYVSVAGSQTLTLNTDTKGEALLSLDTSQWKYSVVLMASSRNTSVNEPYVPNLRRPEYRSAHHHVTAFYSKSSSFVKLSQPPHSLPCGGDASVKAHYIIQGAELKKGQEVLDFYFMVMSRGGVVQHGRAPVNVDTGAVNKGEVSLVLVQTSSLAPVAQVVLYALMPSGEVVADSMDFPVQLCLNNKVSLSFSSIRELPGQTSTLSVVAEPGSLCSIRAIDQSVLLLKKEQELTVDYVRPSALF